MTPEQNNLFYPSFIAFHKEIAHYGALNSLSSLVLNMGSCGIVDLYQGNEWWNFSLMDPDNRRAVDFDFLSKALKTANGEDETLKMWVTAISCRFRRLFKELFLYGEYIPLKAQKKYRENIVAFLRKQGEHCVLIAAGRFFTHLGPHPIGDLWEETDLLLSKNLAIKEFQDIFTQAIHVPKKIKGQLTLQVAELFHTLPFAILTTHF